jgi:hypothetical protein
MEVSCQLVAHALYYRERTAAAIDWEPGWAARPIWTFGKRKNLLSSARTRNLARPGRSPVTILTVLHRISYVALFDKYSGDKLRKIRRTRFLVLIEEREGRTGCWRGHLKVTGRLEGLGSDAKIILKRILKIFKGRKCT